MQQFDTCEIPLDELEENLVSGDRFRRLCHHRLKVEKRLAHVNNICRHGDVILQVVKANLGIN